MILKTPSRRQTENTSKSSEFRHQYPRPAYSKQLCWQVGKCVEVSKYWWYCWRLNYSTTWDVSYQSPWNHRISYCPHLCRIGPPWLATRCHNDLQRAISHGRTCRVTTMPPDAPGTCETWPFMALDVVEYPSGGNIIGSIPPSRCS